MTAHRDADIDSRVLAASSGSRVPREGEGGGLRVFFTGDGAMGEVPGSKYQLIAWHSDGLVEKLGIDMGSRFVQRGLGQRVDTSAPGAYLSNEALIITHAHDDHIAALPGFLKMGFNGPVYMTHLTGSVYSHVDLDGGFHRKDTKERFHLQKRRMGYREPFSPTRSGRIAAEFRDAGHMPGSAGVMLTVRDPGTDEEYRILFGGDIGRSENWTRYFVRPPDFAGLPPLDAVVQETTYGMTRHGGGPESKELLLEGIERSVAAGSPFIVPTFAKRIQRIMQDIFTLREEGRLPQVDGKPYPVIVDCPTGLRMNETLGEYIRFLLDDEFSAAQLAQMTRRETSVEEARERLRPYFSEDIIRLFQTEDGRMAYDAANPFANEHLEVFPNRKSGKEQHDTLVARIASGSPGPFMAVCASGMMSIGRAKDLVVASLPLKDAIVAVTGYQSPSTIGFAVEHRHETVKYLAGKRGVQEVPNLAQMVRIRGYGGHADAAERQTQLLQHVRTREEYQEAPLIINVHGDPHNLRDTDKAVREGLCALHEDGTLMLPEQRLRFNSLLPERGVIYDLTARRHRKD